MSSSSDDDSLFGDADTDQFTDFILDEELCTTDPREFICGGMQPKKFLLAEKGGNCCEPWNRVQTMVLNRSLEAGNYNLCRIKRNNCCFDGRTTIEMHDRALLLLVLQRLMIKDPVSFLHNQLPKEHARSLKMWMKKTKSFEHYFMLYHDLDKNTISPDTKLTIKKKILKAYKIFNNYNAYYESYKGTFDWCFADLRMFKIE